MTSDFVIKKDILDDLISYISAFTKNASPNTDFETHAHEDTLELYYFIKGDPVFSFEGRHIDVKEETFVLISDGLLHRPIIKKNCEYFRKRILFKKECFQRLADSSSLYEKLKETRIFTIDKNSSHYERITSLFSDIEEDILSYDKDRELSALVSLFSLLIKAEKSSAENEKINYKRQDRRVSEIISYIDANLAEDLSYKGISKLFYISEKNLFKLFKKETGFSLGNYVNTRRINMAKRLLIDGASASSTALATGFSDYSVFYRSFLKSTGMSPMQFIQSKKYLPHKM